MARTLAASRRAAATGAQAWRRFPPDTLDGSGQYPAVLDGATLALAIAGPARTGTATVRAPG